MNSGIYQIINKVNNHIYIGSSNNLKSRKNHHFNSLFTNRHRNKHLQSAFNKYGSENFEFNTLIFCNPSMLIWYEQQFIDKWKPEYNIYINAQSNLGLKLSEETKAKISRRIKGTKKPLGFGMKMSQLLSGKSRKSHIVTSETRNKISKTNMNHLVSDESKIKMSLSHKGKPNSNIAKTYSGFISPDGILYGDIFNLSEFCKKNNLNQSLMSAVALGKRNYHKGWTYNPKYDSKSKNIEFDISDVEGN